MEDETTVSDRKQLIHVSNPQRCPGDESDSDWWIHWSFKNWSIRSLMWCDVFTSALQEPPGEEADSGERQHHLQRRGGQRRRSLTPVSRLRPLTHPSPPGSDPLRGRAEPQEAEGVGRRLGGRGGQRQPHPSSETPQRGAGLWDRAGVQTTPTAGPRPGLQPDQVRPESRVQLLHWFKQRRSVSSFLLFLIKMFLLCRFVKTTANATVDHLSKYLALRIALEEGQTNGEAEDRGREEGGGGEAEGRTGSGEGSGLNSISEKQYTIYILTRGGQFSVSVKTFTRQSL